MMTAPFTLPHRAHRGFALLVCATLAWAVPGSAEAADECRVSYTYMAGSGPSAVPQVQQTEVSANTIKTVNREAMRYVVNDRDWAVEVEVTTIGGGTKWVQLLKKGARDPQNGNYVGNIELKRVKCLPGGTAGSGGSGAPSLQAIVDQAFAPLKKIVIANYNLMESMLKLSQLMAKKAVEDYQNTCPNPTAQAHYNDLKQKRITAVQVRDSAQAAVVQAAQALQSCQKLTGNSPLCAAAHTGLPFVAQHNVAVATIGALDNAMAVLRGLKCITGCGQTASISVPNASLKPGGTVSQQVVANNVCTAWDLGGFGVNPTAVLSGSTAQMANVEPPHCSRRENIPLCTRWNVSLLLPKLKELKLVPANLQVANVDLQLPMRSIRVVSGLTPAKCATPLKICKPTGILQFNQGQNAFSVTAGASCTEQVTLGCMSPAFALEPAFTTIQVPDLQRATIRLVGGRFTPAQITVDLTRPEFQVACAGTDITLPLPPTVQLTSQTVALPFLCTKPSFTNLVANP